MYGTIWSMSFITRYIQTLVKTLSEPKFYRYILRTKLSYSLRFFTVSLLFLTIAQALLWIFIDIPLLQKQLNRELGSALTQTPETLQVHYRNNTLTLQGVQLPFTIALLPDHKIPGLPANLLTYQNTKNSTNALITFMPQSFSFYPDSATNPMPYDQFFGKQTFDTNKTGIEKSASSMLAAFPSMIATVLLVASPFLFIGNIIVTLVKVAFYSVFLQSFIWLLNVRLPYRKVFQLGLHIEIASILVGLISLMIFPTTTVPIQLMAFIGISILVGLDLRQIKL